ncbi:MAG: hypothetical protein JJ858_17285 [Rhizobiaceae bacterium]|nr:hypothetical protein [Rhizobiaceae bacterium]
MQKIDAAHEAEELRGELADLIYAISHDFNAPLRHIDGFAKLIKKNNSEVLDEQSLGHLNNIISSSERLSAILNGILSLSRINTRPEEYERVDLSELVKGLLAEREILGPTDSTNQVELGDLPVISCDREQVTLALNALLENAFLYKKEDEPNLIQLSHVVDDYGVKVSISDQGIGVDSRYFKEIFKPLRRAVSQSDFPGDGIGLAIVDKVMHRHNGSVQIESVVDKGTKITLVFPLDVTEND